MLLLQSGERSLPPPALSECSHGGLASGGVAMSRCAILMIAECQRPHPRRAFGRCREAEARLRMRESFSIGGVRSLANGKKTALTWWGQAPVYDSLSW